MSSGPIIVFDSGIGGLSIYRPLKRALPHENIIYFSDPNHFPYGDKSSTWLSERFTELCQEFSLLSPKLVVLACNSATTNIISEVRSHLSCPVVGVEPVIKPLSQFTNSLALMTKATANSKSTLELLKKYGPHVKIFVPTGLAVAIEYNDYHQVKKSISQIKKTVLKYQCEAVGLSCTHYPLILPLLQEAMPNIKFIDPSEAVVQEIQRVLKLNQT